MRLLLIDKNGKEMLGSDGAIKVNKGSTIKQMKKQVKTRNKQCGKHFPHKVAIGFKIWKDEISDKYKDTAVSNEIYYLT